MPIGVAKCHRCGVSRFDGGLMWYTGIQTLFGVQTTNGLAHVDMYTIKWLTLQMRLHCINFVFLQLRPLQRRFENTNVPSWDHEHRPVFGYL